jgi:hypothetical protein
LDKSAAGQSITLRGTNYSKGLGMTAYSRDDYYLGGDATRFQSYIGLDDAAGGQGSVIFRVYTDGTMIFDSGPVTATTPIQTIDLDVTDAIRLTLEVTNALDNTTNDYGDWAEARIVVSAVPSGLTSTAAGGAIDLSWNNSPGAIGYNISRSTNSGGPYSLVGNSTTNSYADTNVLPDMVYYYVVSAINANGQTTNSAPAGTELTPYWTNLLTGTAQNWNAASNWSNTATYPNAFGRAAIINAEISANQTINLNQRITVGSLSVGSLNGSAAYTIAANGGALFLDNSPGAAALTQISSSAGDTISSEVVFNGNITIRNDSTNPLTLFGTVFGGGTLTQTGIGVLALSGSNSFEGQLTNTQGVLRVGNPGALSGCPVVSIASGALLDTSALNGEGLVLTNGQTLSGGGRVNGNLTIGDGASLVPDKVSTVMTFSNALTFSAGAICSLQISKTLMTNSGLAVLGTLTYGGTLTVTNVGSVPFAAGDSFTLFSASNYGGAFADIIPPTPGPGLVWNTNSLGASGTLAIVPAGFVLACPKISGNQLVFSGSGGSPNGSFLVLTSTNLTLPLAQWTTAATNECDGNGYFTFTNTINPNVPVLYYRLQSE